MMDLLTEYYAIKTMYHTAESQGCNIFSTLQGRHLDHLRLEFLAAHGATLLV